jgi:hypothetical protein
VLKSLRIVLSKTNASAVATREVFELLDMLGEARVSGNVDIILECRGQTDVEKARSGK